MKKMFLLFAALALTAACIKFPDYQYSRGYAHDSLGRWDGTGGGEDEEGSSGTGDEPSAALDTTIWITAVSIPDGYDWRKDSVYYLSGGEIIAFEDFSPAVRVKYGHTERVSAATDLHHLIGGDLYTEYCTDGVTYIKKNGELLFSYDGAEVLKGIIAAGDGLYTLGANRSGRGFALRKDGKALFSEQEGSVWGSLDDPTFPASGALYSSGDDYVFFYSKTTSSGQIWFSATQKGARSVELEDDVGRIFDIRSISGVTAYAYRDSRGAVKFYSKGSARQVLSSTTATTKSCRIIPPEGDSPDADDCKIWLESLSGSSSVWKDGIADIISMDGSDYLYTDGDIVAGLNVSDDGVIKIRRSGKGGSVLSGRYYFFNSHCAALCGGKLYMVLTPMEKGGKPVLWVDGVTTEIDLEGFLTGVYVRISQTS